MNRATTIVWFRDDLRLEDNAALYHAIDVSEQVLPIYIFDEKNMADWTIGGASRWWLKKSLKSLKLQLNKLGSDLIIFKGRSLQTLMQVTKETQATCVYWNRRYTPLLIETDTLIKKNLTESGIETKSFAGNLLVEPWNILNKSGSPYKVFTPFWKRLQTELINSPPVIYPEPEIIPALPSKLSDGKSVDELGLYNMSSGWASGFTDYWLPGSAGVKLAQQQFISESISNYPQQRDYPFLDATSRISPHLHFGELSAGQCWVTVWRTIEQDNQIDGQSGSQYNKNAMWVYLRQLAWREFCHYLVFHFPDIDQKPFNKLFENFNWHTDERLLERWQKGETGYPLVDAGMRQLWHTGWMHNRVRMVCASFLTKHLMIHWHQGAKWFWDTLVDADLANNSCGWQWVAGCGADAAPYFRVFNPILQSSKFDANGDYIREWVPELKDLDSKTIHTPWQADTGILEKAGIEIGKTYPHIIIEHSIARQRALDSYASLRDNG